MPEWIGIKGTEDLGGGLKAIFKLENGLHSDTGQSLVTDDMFSRQAYVGLSSDKLGSITLGRQEDITNDIIMPLANGFLIGYQMYHPANLDDYAFTAYNNAVKYTSAPWHGATLEGMYGFADSTTQPGRYVGAGLNYADGPLKAAIVYSAQHDRTIAFGTQLGLTELAGEQIGAAGTFMARSVGIITAHAMYDLNSVWSLRAGYSHVDVQAQNGNSVTMQTGEIGTYIHTSVANLISAGINYSSFAGARYASVGAADIYYLSKRTTIFASFSYEHATGAVAAMPSLSPSSTHDQLGVWLGTQLFF